MNEPLISVVMPVYNTEKFLAVALDSLLNQTETSLEIIAVDDGSTDSCLEILYAAARRDSRLVVISQNNAGIAAARNRGIGCARGRWVAFLDSDDWFDPQTLGLWRLFAENAQLDFLVGNNFRFVETPDEISDVVPIRLKQPWDEVISGENWIVRGATVREWPQNVWLQLIRRDFLIESGVQFVETHGIEDIPWTMQIALAARRVGFYRQPLYGYRRNPSSIMHNSSEKSAIKRAIGYLIVIKQLATTANQQKHNAPLRHAVKRIAYRECRFFATTVRKNVSDKTERKKLAREFFASGLSRVMFQGCASTKDYWRSFRCWYFLRRMLRAA